jgi:(1->4)-alpha-D-glucan 1-alpha-D-glucosylmutase
VSLNEVGGEPRRFGISLDEFHAFNHVRLKFEPWALSATATHDTKRGEDTRVRINVLSEIPGRWKEHVLRWARWNKRKKTKIEGELAPSRADEYLLYQILLGTWPFLPPQDEALTAYIERIQQYMSKAQREAKRYSSWIAPNEPYEQATRDFISAILSGDPVSAFRTDFEPFAAEVSRAGIWNSLSQTLLKLTSPGVPDLYQGTELWDLVLVDPDNRRPVDYAARQAILAELGQPAREPAARAALLQELIDCAPDGRIKAFVIRETLHWRRERSDAFATSDYLPLPASAQSSRNASRGVGSDEPPNGTRSAPANLAGPLSSHVCAFARVAEGFAVIVVVPVRNATLAAESPSAPRGTELWADTHIELPPGLQNRTWRELFTQRDFPLGSSLLIGQVLSDFPVAMLTAESGTGRTAPAS